MVKALGTAAVVFLAFTVVSAQAAQKTPAPKGTTAAHSEPQATHSAKPDPTPSAGATAVPAPAETPEAKIEEPSSKYRVFRAGVYIAPLELPRPGTVGVEFRGWDRFGISIQKSFIPALTFGEIKGKFDSFEIRPRWYPFRGAFHIGLGYGYVSLAGSRSEFISSENVTVKAEVSAKFLAPTIGWTWGAQSGFFYGIDLGAQFTLNAKTTITSSSSNATVNSSQQFQDLANSTERKANDVIDPFTKYVVPVVGLIKIGWMF